MNQQTTNTPQNLLTRLAAGAAAGLAGTAAIAGARTANQKLAPKTMVPEREDPGKFMVEKAESVLPEQTQKQVPEQVESALVGSLHFGYGTTASVIYAALRPRTDNVLLEGAALGVTVWAAGYLGWLPALHLTPPVTKQRPSQVATSLLQHVLYGVVATATYRQLQKFTQR